MKDSIHRTILKKDIINKIKVFADVFNLNITGWSTKEVDEHTHRIELFSKGTPAGYIDAKTSDISPDYPETDMPFTLYTPLGKVTGYYSTHFEEFKYEVAKREKEFNKFDGLFKIVTDDRDNDNNYLISSYVELDSPEGVHNRIVFNRLAGSHLIEIERTGNNQSEEARLYYSSGDLCLDHFHYPQFNFQEMFSKIRIQLEKARNKYQIKYMFKDQKEYEKEFDLPLDTYLPGWRKMELLDYEVVDEDIALFDERLLNFIDEVKNDLYLLANGTEAISVYDKLAALCFHEDKDKFKLGFSRGRKIETALDKGKTKQKSKDETNN